MKSNSIRSIYLFRYKSFISCAMVDLFEQKSFRRMRDSSIFGLVSHWADQKQNMKECKRNRKPWKCWKYVFMNENVTRATITKTTKNEKLLYFMRCVMPCGAKERPHSCNIFHVLCFEYRVGLRSITFGLLPRFLHFSFFKFIQSSSIIFAKHRNVWPLSKCLFFI